MTQSKYSHTGERLIQRRRPPASRVAPTDRLAALLAEYDQVLEAFQAYDDIITWALANWHIPHDQILAELTRVKTETPNIVPIENARAAAHLGTNQTRIENQRERMRRLRLQDSARIQEDLDRDLAFQANTRAIAAAMSEPVHLEVDQATLIADARRRAKEIGLAGSSQDSEVVIEEDPLAAKPDDFTPGKSLF